MVRINPVYSDALIFLILWFVLFMVFASPIYAGQRIGDIAVLNVSPSGTEMSDAQVRILTEQIREVAIKLTNYRVMTEESVVAIMRDKNIDISKCTDIECAVDYGRVLQADKLITTGIVFTEGDYYISMRLYDSSSASIDKSVNRTCEKCTFKDLVAMIREVAEELLGGRVEGKIQLNTGTVIIKSNPADARVFIDGKEAGNSPIEVPEILEGEHEILISKEGYEEVKDTFSIKAGERRVIEKVLRMETGGIEVNTNIKGAVVSIDGEKIGETDEAGDFKSGSVPAGTHRVRVAHADYEPSERTVTVTKGITERVLIALQPKPATLLITSEPAGASVYINSERKGATPVSETLPPGEYSISIEKKGYKSEERRMALSANKSERLHFALKQARAVGSYFYLTGGYLQPFGFFRDKFGGSALFDASVGLFSSGAFSLSGGARYMGSSEQSAKVIAALIEPGYFFLMGSQWGLGIYADFFAGSYNAFVEGDYGELTVKGASVGMDTGLRLRLSYFIMKIGFSDFGFGGENVPAVTVGVGLDLW